MIGLLFVRANDSTRIKLNKQIHLVKADIARAWYGEYQPGAIY